KTKRIPTPFLVQQEEAWYSNHVWIPLIDNLYVNIDGIISKRYEGTASYSSRKRMQTLQGENERKKTGLKPDMTILLNGTGNKPLEFGAYECE
ncbi:hypothetical protein BDB01DRAFT_725458, partial [Pilobolus umbonatus]